MEKTELHKTWEERVSAWEASGQTVQAWCLENDVRKNQLYYWRRKLREPEVSSQETNLQ